MTENQLESEIKALIVETLMLEDVEASEITSEGPLFGEGLGLDSIDALELATAIQRRYSVQTRADDEENRRTFYSVASLARFVSQAQSAGAGPGDQL